MATATLIKQWGDSPGWKSDLRRRESGYAGYRHYKVDTPDEELVHLAAGLPQYGDPWSAAFPLVAVAAGAADADRPDAACAGASEGASERAATWRVSARTLSASSVSTSRSRISHCRNP